MSSNLQTLLTPILYSDGGHNKMTKDEAWGSVTNDKGEDLLETYQSLFSDMNSKIVDLPSRDKKSLEKRRIIISKFNDVKSQQNNGAELIALVVALRIALQNDIIKTIKCDSKLLTDYWSKYLKKESRNKMDPQKAKYIDELIELRKKFEENKGNIEKISGDYNLSDLGFHK